MTQLKCFYTDEPKGNILAIYDDLSGATYFSLRSENAWCCADFEGRVTVDKDWFLDAGYLHFIEDKD